MREAGALSFFEDENEDEEEAEFRAKTVMDIRAGVDDNDSSSPDQSE